MNYETVTPENIANIIRWNNFETSEELYLHEHNITVPVCEFDGCTEPATLQSYFLWYFTYCSFSKHKKALKYRALLKTLETKRKLLEEKTKRDTRTGCCVYCKNDFEYNVNERKKYIVGIKDV